MQPLIVLLPLLLLASADVHADKVAQPIYFRTSVKLTVDASGKVQAAEAPAGMHKALRGVIEGRARDWHFAPTTLNGVAVGGVTYALVGACAIPVDGDGYRVAIDYKRNGPLSTDRPDGVVTPPRYPVDAVRMRKEATTVVDFTVGANGRASLNDIRYEGDSAAGHQYFDAAIRRWVEAMRYTPERLGDAAVATRIQMPVEFFLGERPEKKPGAERHGESSVPECQAAVPDTSEQPLAVDSPFRKLDAG